MGLIRRVHPSLMPLYGGRNFGLLDPRLQRIIEGDYGIELVVQYPRGRTPAQPLVVTPKRNVVAKIRHDDYVNNNRHTALNLNDSLGYQTTDFCWFSAGISLDSTSQCGLLGMIGTGGDGVAIGIGEGTSAVPGNKILGLKGGWAWGDGGYLIGTGFHSITALFAGSLYANGMHAALDGAYQGTLGADSSSTIAPGNVSYINLINTPGIHLHFLIVGRTAGTDNWGITLSKTALLFPPLVEPNLQFPVARTLYAVSTTTSPDVSSTLAGKTVSVQLGTLASTITAALSGKTATVNLGTLGSSTGINATSPLVGQGVVVGLGTVTPTILITLAGKTITIGQGALNTTFAVTIAGKTVTVGSGTLSSTLAVTPTSKTVTIGLGAISSQVGGSPTQQLQGQLVSVNLGTLSQQVGMSQALTGVAVSANKGLLASGISTTVALTGVNLPVNTGILTPSASITALLAGANIVVNTGSITIQSASNVTTALAGYNLSVHTGFLAILVPTVQALRHPVFVTNEINDISVVD